jgi:chemotaxis methyl-accepting protein methylase/chemotaxis response regulator CheB/signal transduction histidine kinase
MSDGSDSTPVLVVGIGASAGGIEALKELFTAMPSDSGLAFVVIQHLEPTHESRMADILGKCTSMKVVQARDGMLVQANHVYANPAGKYTSIDAGRLVVSERSERDRIRMPIDFFLTSLAEDQHEAAVGIILSGSSGSDGTRGVRAVREAGGMCMAQDPQTAQFPAMPQSAIDTGLVDHVLAVAMMPAALVGYAQHAAVRASPGHTTTEAAADDLEPILKLLRTRTSSDYRHYKKTTIIRRIHRRMGINQVADMADYLTLLEEDQGELTRLSRDMLIGVSSFFRDAEAFEELRKEAIVPLVARSDPDNPLRAWVPGCASGEEAYSVAMLMLESVAAAGTARPVQVFASDVDDHALEVGRAGVYAESIAEAITPTRLERFFTRQGQKYQVTTQLREAVVFSRQDLIADPPFSKLDLISCRNVLIYIEPAFQKKVLALFSFALTPGGYLFLGKSEGIAEMEDHFEPVSKPRRIYRLIRPNRQAAAAFPLRTGGRPVGQPERKTTVPPATALAQANQDVLLRHFKASIVLVNPKGQILHFYGETERYLGHPKGPASLNVLDMITGTLSAKLRRAMERAFKRDEAVKIPRAPVPRAGTPLADLTVMPVPTAPEADKLLAIIFEDTSDPRSSAAALPVSAEDEPLVTQLEQEVNTLRSELRADAEEFDTANEELRAANEEVMSMNEELQSANEELEASKEELQSVNEELTTVNSQLNDNLAELTTTNNDLANLLAATEIATVFLDSQLRIKRFTPRATELLNLIPADRGRPISHISQNFDGKELAAESEKTLSSLTPTEREVQTHDGRWHTMRILPYRTLDDRIDGVVITFSDVTRLKRVEQERRELEGRVLHSQKLESLGVLAGGVAHDFNNLLTGVLGSASLAQELLPDNEPVRELIKHIERAGHRAADLTRQMLAYSGKGRFEVVAVSLPELVHEMAELVKASISKKVALEFDFAKNPPLIEADATQLRQLVMNLVMNAAEAIGDTGGSVTIRSGVIDADSALLAAMLHEEDVPEGLYVFVEVADTGCGMDPETQAKMFEPFFTTKFTGRGLGLAAVQGIVRGHRGAFQVRSAPGQGTCFRVLFPASKQPLVRRIAEEPTPAMPHRTGAVLLVDDEEVVRTMAQRILEHGGFTVRTADGGRAAMEAFREHHERIDAVLLDLTMPDLGGEEVYRKLLEIRSGVPVVVVSGYSEEHVAERFAGIGSVEFLAKPYKAADLIAKVGATIAAYHAGSG